MKRLTFTCDLVPLLNTIGFTKCEKTSTDDYSVFVNGIIEITIEHETKKVITELVIGSETQECNIESIGDLKVLCRVVNGLKYKEMSKEIGNKDFAPTLQTDVMCCPRRVNVFNAKGKLIGQDYQRDNGEWMHKWIDLKTGTFERGSWRGKCQGEDMRNWSYENCISVCRFA